MPRGNPATRAEPRDNPRPSHRGSHPFLLSPQ